MTLFPPLPTSVGVGEWQEMIWMPLLHLSKRSRWRRREGIFQILPHRRREGAPSLPDQISIWKLNFLLRPSIHPSFLSSPFCRSEYLCIRGEDRRTGRKRNRGIESHCFVALPAMLYKNQAPTLVDCFVRNLVFRQKYSFISFADFNTTQRERERATVRVKNMSPSLCEPLIWLPLAERANSRNLRPTFISIPVLGCRQSQKLERLFSITGFAKQNCPHSTSPFCHPFSSHWRRLPPIPRAQIMLI